MTLWASRIRPALLVVVATWGAAYLSSPFGWDQGIYAWVGDTILHGGMPYRDAWDIKGPLPYYAFAAAQALFGRTLWGIRLLDLVLLAAAALALRAIIRGLGRPGAGDWGGLGFVLWYANGTFWHTAQPDGWVAMLSALGFAPLFSKDAKPVRTLGLAGLVVGLGLIVKPNYVLLALVPATYLVVNLKGRRIVPVLACVAGAALPVAVTALWFGSQGAWSDLVEVHLRYPLSVYAGELDFDELLGRTILYLVFPAAVVGWWRLRSDRRPDASLLLVWTLATLLIVVSQGRFFSYQWLPALPPLGILAALGFHAVLGEDAGRRGSVGRQFAGLVLLALTLRLLMVPTFETAHFAAYAIGLESEAAYYDHFGSPGSEMRAARYIRDQTEEGEPVLVWGWHVAINYMSARPSPSRFGFSMPLMMGPGSDYREAYRKELMAALHERPPAIVVDAPQAGKLLEGAFDMRDFPALHEYVRQHYRIDRRIGDLILYRRKDRPRRVSASSS